MEVESIVHPQADTGNPALLTVGPRPDDECPLLGLTPADRLKLSAARAGLSFADGALPPGCSRVVIVPGDVVAEPGWMTAAAAAPLDTAAWGRAGDALLVAGPDALAALDETNARNLSDLADVGERLTEQLGPPADLGLERPPPRLPSTRSGSQGARPADRRAAERYLLSGLVKKTDGFLASRIARPVSLAVSRRLAPMPVTPNQMTLVTGAIGLAAAPFFLFSAVWLQAIGGLLFLLHSILDGCDGELARLKFKESRWGGLLDFWSDNVVHVAVFGCMALGWARAEDSVWPLLFGAGAVLGTAGSAAFVHWRTLRPKRAAGPVYTSVAAGPGNTLSGLLDGLSRRDFIYLVFVLSLFGKAFWFLAAAGIGTPLFLILLLVLAAGERRAATA